MISYEVSFILPMNNHTTIYDRNAFPNDDTDGDTHEDARTRQHVPMNNVVFYQPLKEFCE